jgi:hypothetical protein
MKPLSGSPEDYPWGQMQLYNPTKKYFQLSLLGDQAS